MPRRALCDIVTDALAAFDYQSPIKHPDVGKDMTQNLGKLDRWARFAIGALLIAFAVAGTIGLWGFLGAILVGTAFVNFCPIYRVFGFKTCQDC